MARSNLATYTNRHGIDCGCPDCGVNRAVLALLTAESPCIASVEDIVRVDSDGYVTIYAQQSLRGDEAQWCGVQVLRAAEKAEGVGK